MTPMARCHRGPRFRRREPRSCPFPWPRRRRPPRSCPLPLSSAHPPAEPEQIKSSLVGSMLMSGCQISKSGCRHNLLPVARRSNGDCQTGSSPDSGSSLSRAFPKLCSSGILRERSPLQWRDRAGFAPDFPIKPIRAPIPICYFCYAPRMRSFSFPP